MIVKVIARSSPQDKKILVDHLKALDEVVAVTGDGYDCLIEYERERVD